MHKVAETSDVFVNIRDNFVKIFANLHCSFFTLEICGKIYYVRLGSAISDRDNLEVVWAEFSTLSLAVILDSTINVQRANGHF